MSTPEAPPVSPDIPSAHWRAILHALEYLPQGSLSRGFGHIADIRLPRPARRAVLGAFARTMGINTAEAELDLREYSTINEFFVRRLRPGARTIDARPDRVVSPVDGVIGQTGRIENGTLVQAKGRYYSATSLLADAAAARRYNGGTFVTVYLSPRHYHRIHAPEGGVITHAVHLPGALLPVNAPSVQHVESLFSRNERLICYIEGTAGSVAVVAVGAYNVGRISAAFDRAWRDGAHVTNRAGAVREERSYDPPIPVAPGEEIMAFHLGSTVVLLFENAVTLEGSAAAGTEVRMGSSIGSRS